MHCSKPFIGLEPMTYALPWRYSTTELKGLYYTKRFILETKDRIKREKGFVNIYENLSIYLIFFLQKQSFLSILS